MRYRMFGRTGWSVSEISFGAWAIGASWGAVDDDESLAALHSAVDAGVNFIDTADVYGDGRSERLVARLRRERPETLYVATKAGRRLQPHTAEGYTLDNLRTFVERSLRNLGTEALDVLQLHCPPAAVYRRREVFDALDRLTAAGLIRHYGVSVETVDEALQAIEYPAVQSVQIILNVFRQKPLERFLHAAASRDVAVIARVPLASGLLSGKITAETQFAADDHRNFNRHGEAFDVGETFSGVDFDAAIAAVHELRQLTPPGVTLAQLALRWILDQPGVTCAIPGAKRASQVQENCAASDLPSLDEELMRRISEIYDRRIRALVHHRW